MTSEQEIRAKALELAMLTCRQKDFYKIPLTALLENGL
jgi:hypothetical protein